MREPEVRALFSAEEILQLQKVVRRVPVADHVYDYVVNVQHRGEGAAERTTRQIVRGFLEKLTSDPELAYVLDTIREPALDQK